jgi:hypothetical protein
MAIYDQKCKLSKRTNRQISLALLRLPLSRFLTLAVEIVKGWSTARNPLTQNHVPFATVPKVETALWTKAYQWALSGIESVQDGESTFFVRPSTSTSKAKMVTLVNKKKKKDDKMDWKDFEEFIQSKTSLWMVSNLTLDTYLKAECTCDEGQKKNVWKHSLGLAIRKSFCQVPSKAKDIPIGQKRKRGGPVQDLPKPKKH